MLRTAHARSVLPVKDIDRARRFWTGTLGLDVVMETDEQGVILEAGGGTRILMYESEGAGAAPNTVLDFDVDDIDVEVASLARHGVGFERYDGLDGDEHGIVEMGPFRCAWFLDSEGNTIGVTQRVRVMA